MGRRHSLTGESRAAAAGMFAILPVGHSGPWSSRGGCLICQTKVVNACLDSEVLGRLGSSMSGRQGLQHAGGEQSRTFWGGWEGEQHRAALKALLPRKEEASRSAGA